MDKIERKDKRVIWNGELKKLINLSDLGCLSGFMFMNLPYLLYLNQPN